MDELSFHARPGPVTGLPASAPLLDGLPADRSLSAGRRADGPVEVAGSHPSLGGAREPAGWFRGGEGDLRGIGQAIFGASFRAR